MSLMKHLIFIYDMTNKARFQLMNYSKKPSPSVQCQLGTSKIQIQPRILKKHKEKQGLLELLFWTLSSVFASSLVIYFCSRD